MRNGNLHLSHFMTAQQDYIAQIQAMSAFARSWMKVHPALTPKVRSQVKERQR